MKRLALATWICGCGVAAAEPAVPPVPVTLVATESVIRITPTYRGELVRLVGTAPAACAVVVQLTSGREDLVCSRRGKVGPFWLSVGRVHFRGVPLMYKVNSSEPLNEVVDGDERLRYGLGRRALKASVSAPPGPDGDLYLDELIRGLQRERLYDFEEGAVDREGDSFRTTFFWPPDAPSGRYFVEAYAVRAGRVVGSARTEVDVRTVGIEAWVRALARTHGLLYGLLSVGLAGVTGLAASLVFDARARRGPPPPAAARR
jgi:uncharacterized protein (TIGR02186 family)